LLFVCITELSVDEKMGAPVVRCRSIAAPSFALLTAILAPSCDRRAPGPPPAPATARDAAPRPAAAPPPATAEPTALLALPVSAYHVSLVTEADGTATLLTSSAAYRLPPGAAPAVMRQTAPAVMRQTAPAVMRQTAPAVMRIDLGLGAAATRSSFIYWSRGAVFAAPKTGGAPHRLFALARQPQQLVASGEDFAWLQRSDDGVFSLHALVGKKQAAVYTSSGSIDAVAMLDGAITFVERPAGAGWRIGRVPRAGGDATFTAARDGRPPSMLAAARDIHYYDGNRQEVRRLSPDLQRERTLASGFVCSPIAVSAHVYCAQVDGIFELRLDERPRRIVVGNAGALATDLAATPKRLFWVVDAGADRLEVRSIELRR
jgi:hypothetical protein